MSALEPWIQDGVSGVVADPVISLVIPAMNEEVTIGEFVDWCHEGLRSCGVPGEIIIVDSSTDATADIAISRGARVLHVPKRGLGRAYLDAIPFIRGKWVIMGDADLTYEFRDLTQFVRAFKEGGEFIMGSRFKGGIESGAMPRLHRYFGTPATTWLLNRMYGTRFSDIHCGMRGVTLDGLKRMQLNAQGWGYASEMIITAVHLGLVSTEVPVPFFKDRIGRESHHKRTGWVSPWIAGWLNLKVFFTYGADVFLIKPGVAMSLSGGVGVGVLGFGPIVLGGVGLSLHWMLFFMVIALLGLNFAYAGIFARLLYDLEGEKSITLRRKFDLDRMVPLAGLLVFAGMVFQWPLVSFYFSEGFKLPERLGSATHQFVAGLCLEMSGFIIFTGTLVIQAILARLKRNLR